MNGTLIERFRRWMCRKFGHRPYREAMTEAEFCTRCRQLLSTRYSRSKP